MYYLNVILQIVIIQYTVIYSFLNVKGIFSMLMIVSEMNKKKYNYGLHAYFQNVLYYILVLTRICYYNKQSIVIPDY